MALDVMENQPGEESELAAGLALYAVIFEEEEGNRMHTIRDLIALKCLVRRTPEHSQDPMARLKAYAGVLSMERSF